MQTLIDYGTPITWGVLTVLAAAGTVLFVVETYIRGREAHARGVDRVRRARELSEIPHQRSRS